MQRRYAVKSPEMRPKVYFRLTDDWLELAVRFVVEDHGIRTVKDRMSRQILQALDEAGISLASAGFEIVWLPPLEIENVSGFGIGGRSAQ